MRAPSLRNCLFLVLVVSLIGTTAELLMLDHRETFTQWIPYGVFGVGILATAAVAIKPNALTLNVLRLAMLLLVATGVVGLYFHYRGNVAFELEMSPALRGWALIKGALTGATPTLAPGAMSQIGLLGLLFTYRHPALTQPGSATRQQSEVLV
jgi:hypothetical protein